MSTKNVTLHDENGNVLLPATKTSRVTDANGTNLDTLLQQAGQVKSISVNGVTQTIDANGNVNIASADGVGIASVVQTTTSSEDGGTNVITVTKTDNTTSTFSVKNGSKGSTGAQGPQGERGLPGESGVTGDVSGFTVIQTIDPSATYGATDIAGAATVQATNAELTELAGGLHKFIGLTASITIPAALPAGYTLLDYIANTSSSGGYIDTGIKPNDGYWKFEGSWMLTGAIVAYQTIVASYSAETANSYRVIYNNTSTTSVLINAGTKASTATASSANGVNEWNTFSIQYGTATINGTVVTLGTTAGTATTNNICLFGRSSSTNLFVGKMKRFKAWHSGTLVRDMIPCINPQSVYGMYDIVNDVFYGSSSENNFTGGN